jgi:hypothetical protein
MMVEMGLSGEKSLQMSLFLTVRVVVKVLRLFMYLYFTQLGKPNLRNGNIHRTRVLGIPGTSL